MYKHTDLFLGFKIWLGQIKTHKLEVFKCFIVVYFYVSISNYKASNGGMISEEWIRKDLEGSDRA
jgi:hypothetical protein